MFLDSRIGELAADRLQSSEGALLVRPHQPRVARHISGENGSQLAFDASHGQGGAPQPVGRLRHRLSDGILTMKARPGIPLSLNVQLFRARGRLGEGALTNGPPSVKDARRRLNASPWQARQSPPIEHGIAGAAKKVRSCRVARRTLTSGRSQIRT
jgi:hypothetical protein